MTKIAPYLSVAMLIYATTVTGCRTTSAASEQEPPNAITVSGTGRVAVKPDSVMITVGSEARAPALADATADVGRRMADVLARVKALGVPEQNITTVTYSVDPIAAPRRSDEEASHISGYRVINVVRLRIDDVAAAGRIVDGAVAAGANTMSALQFTLKDPARAESQARRLAVMEAETKAREIAAAADVHLGPLLSITEGPSPREIIAGRSVMAMATGPGPVEAGQLEIVVHVQARYRIVPP